MKHKETARERALTTACTAERQYNYKQKERPKINQTWK